VVEPLVPVSFLPSSSNNHIVFCAGKGDIPLCPGEAMQAESWVTISPLVEYNDCIFEYRKDILNYEGIT
jgi:hypothetical protein